MPANDEDIPEQEGGVTRRRLFLKLGQTAVAIGLTDTVEAQPPGKPALPPGVYDPSTDHLAHALMSNSPFHSIPPDSPTDYVRPRTEPFTPRFFSVPEFAVVRRMVEIVLGETSSPANHANLVDDVAEWVDLSIASAAGIREANLHLSAAHRALTVAFSSEADVTSLETSDAQKTSREGLAWLADYVRGHYNSEFLQLSVKDQVDVVTAMSDTRPDKQAADAGTRFFTLIKDETIRGFYTSQAGLKELDYKGNAFYAVSPGCPKH